MKTEDEDSEKGWEMRTLDWFGLISAFVLAKSVPILYRHTIILPINNMLHLLHLYAGLHPPSLKSMHLGTCFSRFWCPHQWP
jgi:hypothetical protein